MSEYKVPKGTRDSNPEAEKLRQKLIEECEKQFLLYNAVRIDTPTFELYSLLMEKYNDENTKEIYVLENKNDNGEKCALRYDLTVPFSRYVKTNRVNNMRKYQIGKVFRRDNPSPGRYREFYQCDYDCLGDNIEWITDAETLILLNNILAIFQEKYNMPNYVIRINSREILSDIMIECNISPELFLATCSCIDKLDKCEWKKVANELLAKGICQESIDKLESILQQTEINQLDFVKPETRDKINKMLNFINLSTKQKSVFVLDLTIVRGLDYYTNLIFEVKLENTLQNETLILGKPNNISIAAGGRYNKLCSSPCVGFSLGIDRILNYVSYKFINPLKVWIVRLKSTNEEQLLIYSMEILEKLRNNNIIGGTEMKYCNPNKSMLYAIKSEIPYIIFLGDDEFKNQNITLKCVLNKTQNTMAFEEVLSFLNLSEK
jgi:histidyl-tRNA synthetase